MTSVQSDGQYNLCEGKCGKRVDPGDADVIEAVEIFRADALGGTDYVEGFHVFFHRGCFPARSPRYRVIDPY